MLTIALAQINSCVGAIEKNAEKIISIIRQAKARKVSMVIFPELALTGYPPEDLLLKPHFVEKNLYYLKKIKEECKNIVALVGFVDRAEGRLYNACAFLQEGKIKDIYRKIYLPNYGVFDEKRYFHSGNSLSFYTFKGYQFSVSICEDVWKEAFITVLRKRQPDFIVTLSASPFHLGKISLREKTMAAVVQKTGAFLFYCNLVGGQDELVFDGTSMVVSPSGEVIARGKRFAEDMLVFNLSRKKQYLSKEIKLSPVEETFEALRLGLHDYVYKNGFKDVLVGISGGIDSALVAALAVKTLGNNRVHGLIMPSRYTSVATLRDAKKICEKLGIAYQLVDIDELFDCYLKVLQPFFAKHGQDKTEENLQARIRGNLLMAFSNKFGSLVLNTGNKSEVSAGYCTLYGDMVGGFGLLKDVPKTLVYELARHINMVSKKELIPSSVIKRAPSAELKPNQKDQDTLPPYEVLDALIKLYVEEECSLEDITAKGFNEQLVKRVIRMIDASEYKRRQAPIGIKITPRAFGKDRRMPITNEFRQ
ncbi:MAG: NAD+ synthase [Candidatus Omnitrophota bacterium]